MQIFTTRFGNLEIDETKILHFAEGLPGFAGARDFIVLPHVPADGVTSPFKWLQSTEEAALALPIMNPWLADPTYSPTVPGLALAKLDITDVAAQGRIYAVVTIPRNNPTGATVNLVAPILINKKSHRAIQVILSQDRFSMRVPLAPTYPSKNSCGSGLVAV